jgi:hypothetical protein
MGTADFLIFKPGNLFIAKITFRNPFRDLEIFQ